MGRDNVVLVIESSSPSGLLYKIPGTKTWYTASREGQPPAVREGLYRDSWKVAPAVVEDGRVTALFYSDKRVGPWLLGLLLELGTEDMGPRPHIAMAMEITAKQASKMLMELRQFRSTFAPSEHPEILEALGQPLDPFDA